MRQMQYQSTDLYTDYVRDWKEKGGKVIGYACVATPVELIEAAGILPYRIKAFGHPDTELGDAYLARFNCRFCRSCLQLGLEGSYDFLDGLLETNGCDHLRGMFENWQHVKRYDFFHYLKVPHFLREDSLQYFTDELSLMRQAICEYFGVEITDEKVMHAVDVYDEVSAKLKKLYALREKVPPAVTGAEVMQVLCTGSSMMGEDFSELLDEVLAEKEGAVVSDYKARLIIMGSATDELDLIEDIESTGAFIAADALCFGSRSFWNRQGESGEPMRLLAERYLRHLFCPRMFTDYDGRRDYILETARRAGVDGAIVTYNKFCDLHGVESVSLRSDLEAAGIPVLVLEKDYGSKADTGRIKTRVQAFLEKLGK